MSPPLWHHQTEAVAEIIASRGWMIPHDMGTGKTRTAIEAMVESKVQRVLIMCPKNVVPVWAPQFERWAPGSFAVISLSPKMGTTAQRAKICQAALDGASARNDRVAIIVNYEAAWRSDLKRVLLANHWGMIICDESHRIKSAGGKASTFASLLTARAEHRVCMTGTPMPHGPLDLYGQFRFMDPTVFGKSFSRFRAEYARMGGYGGHEVDEYLNLDMLTAKFESKSSRVISADDVLDLPGLHEYDRVVELEPSAMATYRQLEGRFIADLAEGTITAANVLTRLLRLSQCTGGTVRTDEGSDAPVSQAKEEALEEIMDELERDEPLVVFCRFRNDLDAVHRASEAMGRQSMELSGRRNQLAEWQGGHCSVLAVQIQSGGVGIDLTRARYAVYYSVNYSLGDYDQSRRRLYRPGQTRRTTYIHLVADQTIDQDIYRALSERRDLVETVLNKHKENNGH